MIYSELDLSLRQRDGRYVASLRLRTSAGDVGQIATDCPTALDPGSYASLMLEPDAYGKQLSAQLFASSPLREAWSRVQGYAMANSAGLRLRLHIAPDAAVLHELRWETLDDLRPATSTDLDVYRPISRSERVLFSRYLDVATLPPYSGAGLAAQHALVVVADPDDLPRFGLSPIDVAGEVARTSAALSRFPISLLASRHEGARVTLNRLIDALRAAPPIVYLVCHSTTVEGASYLWLEREHGGSDRVSVQTFIERFAGLSTTSRPRLIVLAACGSAGSPGRAPALAALGPQLMREGVGAVLGMQDDVPVTLVERLMPRLFTLLREAVPIDLALARARATLSAEEPWWMPALFMRVPEGRLWSVDQSDSLHKAARGIDAFRELLRDQSVRELVVGFEGQIKTARAQVDDVTILKDLHDQLHQLQFQCYGPLANDIALRFPSDELAVDMAFQYKENLGDSIHTIRAIMAKAPTLLNSGWVADLQQVEQLLGAAIDGRDTKLLERALSVLNRVLVLQAPRINADLLGRVRAMRLHDLLDALTKLHGRLLRLDLDPAQLSSFEVGMAALGDLARSFVVQITHHDGWQTLESEARMVAYELKYDDSQLELVWPDMSRRLLQLADSSEEWATNLQAHVALLQRAISANPRGRVVAEFHKLSRLMGKRFFQVDVDLLYSCSRLRELRGPLGELLQEL